MLVRSWHLIARKVSQSLEIESRIGYLDGFRAVAALLVLFPHALPGTQYEPYMAKGAILGVSMFFVLSGYLISRPFVNSFLLGNTMPNVKKYTIRRIFRIVPLYYTVLATIIVFTQLIPPYGYGHVSFEWWTVVKQVLFLQVMSPSSLINSLTFTSWTLSLEMLFYIVVPVLFAILNAFKFDSPSRIRLLLVSLVVIIALSLLVRSQYAYAPTVSHVIQLLSYLSLFCFGVFVATLHLLFKSIAVRQYGLYALSALLLLAGLWNMSIFSMFESELLGLAFAVVLFSILTIPGTLIAKVVSWKPMAFLGLISYGIYIWQPVLTFYASYFHIFHLRVPILLVLTLAISTVTFYFIELPLISWSRKWSEKRFAEKAETEVMAI